MKLDQSNKNTLFILLFISIELSKFHKKLKIKSYFKPEDIAVRIKEASTQNDKYLGYLAWAQIYFSKPEKKEFGISVLKEMMEYYP